MAQGYGRINNKDVITWSYIIFLRINMNLLNWTNKIPQNITNVKPNQNKTKQKQQWHASPPSYNLLRRISVVITSQQTASEPCLLHLTPKTEPCKKPNILLSKLQDTTSGASGMTQWSPVTWGSEDQQLKTMALNKLSKMVDRWKKIAASFSPLRPPFHGFIITKPQGKQSHQDHTCIRSIANISYIAYTTNIAYITVHN